MASPAHVAAFLHVSVFNVSKDEILIFFVTHSFVLHHKKYPQLVDSGLGIQYRCMNVVYLFVVWGNIECGGIGLSLHALMKGQERLHWVAYVVREL